MDLQSKDTYKAAGVERGFLLAMVKRHTCFILFYFFVRESFGGCS